MTDLYLDLISVNFRFTMFLVVLFFCLLADVPSVCKAALSSSFRFSGAKKSAWFALLYNLAVSRNSLPYLLTFYCQDKYRLKFSEVVGPYLLTSLENLFLVIDTS